GNRRSRLRHPVPDLPGGAATAAAQPPGRGVRLRPLHWRRRVPVRARARGRRRHPSRPPAARAGRRDPTGAAREGRMSWLFEPGRPWRAIDSALAAAVARRWPGIPDELLRLFAATAFAAGQGHGALDPGALIHADEFGLPDWPADRWLALLS